MTTEDTSSKDINAKDKIIKTTIDLLNEIDDPDKITIRQIAERANVGTGLINYHFQTKENLLYKAISETMSEMAVNLQKLNDSNEKDPVERLKTMLKELSDFGMHHSKLNSILASYDLHQGNMQTPLYLIPILREIYGSKKDEIEMRIIALQIIATLQVACINPSALQLYIGVNVDNKAHRDHFIDTIVNSVVKAASKK